jgi:hypothetical protein
MMRPFTLLIGLTIGTAMWLEPATAQAPNVPAPPAARDQASDLAYWNAVQAANSCDAARAYSQHFPNGVFVELARLAERRLCGGDRAIMVVPAAPALLPSPPPPPPVAAAPPPPPTMLPPPAAQPPAVAPPTVAVVSPPAASDPSPAAPEADQFALVRNMQLELHRLGCAGSNVDGQWGPAMRTAVTRFNRYAKATLDPAAPSSAAIAALREHEERVCPLECGRGYRVKDDACVAIEAPPRREREAKRPPPDQRRRPEASPAPARAPAAPKTQFTSPLCESRIQVGNKWCCTHDPPRGPSIIICN